MTKNACVFIFFCAAFFSLHSASLHIDNLEELKSYSNKDPLTSISVSDLSINSNFWEAFDVVDRSNLQILSFDNCSFEEFSFLNNMAVSTLNIINSDLSDENLVDLSGYINVSVSELNFRRNNLGKEIESFKDGIARLFDSVDQIYLFGNPIDPELQSSSYKGKEKIIWVDEVE